MSTTSDPDRYSHLCLELACPKCAATGLIPLKRLDRVLFCYGCHTRFRVKSTELVELCDVEDDRIAVHVRTNSSEWREHEAVIAHEPSVRDRLRACVLGLLTNRRVHWAAACVTIVMV